MHIDLSIWICIILRVDTPTYNLYEVNPYRLVNHNVLTSQNECA